MVLTVVLEINMSTSRRSHALLWDSQDPVLDRRKGEGGVVSGGSGLCRGERKIRQVYSASASVCVAVNECEVETERQNTRLLQMAVY